MAATVKAVNVSVVFKDEAGDLTSRTFEMIPASFTGAEDVPEALAIADNFVSRLSETSDAGVAYFQVTLRCTPTTPTTAQSGSEVENTALVSVPLTVVSPNQMQQYGILSIPAPKIGLFVASSGPNKNIVDYNDLEDLIALFLSGADFTMSDGQTATADLGSGKRVHKRSKRGRGRRMG